MGIVGTHPGSFRKSCKQKELQDTELGRRYGRWEMKEVKEVEIKEAKRKMRETCGLGGGAVDNSRPMLA
jgi:hypothetical protein